MGLAHEIYLDEIERRLRRCRVRVIDRLVRHQGGGSTDLLVELDDGRIAIEAEHRVGSGRRYRAKLARFVRRSLKHFDGIVFVAPNERLARRLRQQISKLQRPLREAQVLSPNGINRASLRTATAHDKTF